jgi:hypothetical protein
MADDEFTVPEESDDGDDAAPGEGRPTGSDRPDGVDPDSPPDRDVATTGDDPATGAEGADHGTGRPDEESPLGGLARSVRERRARRADADGADDPTADLVDEQGEEAPAADPEELFESVEVGDVDSESVWASLEDEGEATQGVPGESVATEGAQPDASVDEDGPGPAPFGAAVERVERDDPGAVRSDHVVPKKKFCQQCQYFSAPPTVACSHEGTDIVEIPDTDHFRVRGCPMVEESER